MITEGLPLFRRPSRIARELVAIDQKQPLAYLLQILADGRWHTSKQLSVYGFGERQLRELVESSEGRVLSFPGSPGYKSFDHATVEEIEQTRALLNQGRAMIRRFLRYKKRYHRRS